MPRSPAADDTQVSCAFWAGSQDRAAAALFHPFVQALQAGDLPQASFQHFLGQDATYLQVCTALVGQACHPCMRT